MGLEIIPIFTGSESFLALRCYPRLRDVPGKIDIVEVFSAGGINLAELAREAVEKRVTTFWIENQIAAAPEVEEILSNGCVQLVEYESLVVEYLKHAPFIAGPPLSRREIRKAVKVSARMSKNPVSVKPHDGLQDAISKMERGHFRHLPVIDDDGKLIGMLSDRDIRSIRPSLALVDKNDAMVQLWSLSVQQAAVFDPVKVTPETTLKETGALMLRWHIGGLPVVDHGDKLIGIITYTDLLRELVGAEES
jgi:acetoin utilization protein AcuB